MGGEGVVLTKGELQDFLSGVLDAHQDPTGRVLVSLGALRDRYGYVPEEALGVLAGLMGVTRHRLESVCAFFPDFSTVPTGDHAVIVCDGTACHAQGAREIVQAVEQALGVKVGQTTPDGRFTLKTVGCVGSCGQAPIMIVDAKTHARVRLSEAAQIARLVADED